MKIKRLLIGVFFQLLSVFVLNMNYAFGAELRIVDNLGLIRFLGEVKTKGTLQVTVGGSVVQNCELLISDLSGFNTESRVAVLGQVAQIILSPGSWKIVPLCKVLTINQVRLIRDE